MGRHGPSDGIGPTCIGHVRMAERLPPMDAGDGCPMDEAGQSVRQCGGTATHQHGARPMQVHLLLPPPAPGAASLLQAVARPGDFPQMLPPASRREGRTADDCRRNLLPPAEEVPGRPRTSNASQMGKMLQALGVQRTHTRQGNAHLVVPV